MADEHTKQPNEHEIQELEFKYKPDEQLRQDEILEHN
jgi:hypothetical protein